MAAGFVDGQTYLITSANPSGLEMARDLITRNGVSFPYPFHPMLLMSAAADQFRAAVEAASRARSAVGNASPETQKVVQKALTDMLDAHRRIANQQSGDVSERLARFRRLYAATQPDLEQAPDEFLRNALKALAEALPAEAVAFAVLGDNGEIRHVIGHGIEVGPTDDRNVLGLSASVIRKVQATQGSIAIADISMSQVFSVKESIVSSGPRSVMCVPVISGKTVWGAAYADRRNVDVPFKREDLEVLTAFVGQTGAALQAYDRLARLASGADDASRHRIIGRSSALKHLLSQLDAVADTDATVLITGESGTGKELLARALHASGPRAKGPFVAINCGAIPEHLLESTLFGHKKGSFTGATSDEGGFIAAAERGTLFLDEIGDMPLQLQVKLLRIMQTGTYTRVGDATELQANVRWVAATHTDLPIAIKEKTFREDLYYRLAVFDLAVPPLRERQEDIALLADHFLRQFSAAYNRPAHHFSTEALLALEAYLWPGNVRELENVVQRAVILSDSPTILPSHLPPVISEKGVPATSYTEEAGAGYHETVRNFKRRFLERSLELNEGSRTATAESLGLNRTYFSRLLRQLGLLDEGE